MTDALDAPEDHPDGINPALQDPREDDYGPCCALDEGHDGLCAYICPECEGTQRCRECDDLSIDDFGGCGECGSAGGCSYCYEGMVVDDAFTGGTR